MWRIFTMSNIICFAFFADCIDTHDGYSVSLIFQQSYEQMGSDHDCQPSWSEALDLTPPQCAQGRFRTLDLKPDALPTELTARNIYEVQE